MGKKLWTVEVQYDEDQVRIYAVWAEDEAAALKLAQDQAEVCLNYSASVDDLAEWPEDEDLFDGTLGEPDARGVPGEPGPIDLDTFPTDEEKSS